MNSLLCHLAQLSAAIMYCLLSTVSAATPAEQKMLSAPMPHVMLDQSVPRAKVHFVSLRGYLEGMPTNTIRLVQLKEQVQSCVSDLRRSGGRSSPPVQWPDYLTSMREDIYLAADRTIRYTNAIAYGINFTDCSLLEVYRSKARLVSSQGVCNIDLLKKTATGMCDAGAKSGNAEERRDATGISAILRAMAADPRSTHVADLQKSRRPGDTRTGDRKTIAGLECEVWRQIAVDDDTTICVAQGRVFTPSPIVGNHAEAGLLLEYESKHGPKMKAVDAKLDAEVNSQIFQPHLTGSFVITSRMPRK